MHLKGLKCSLQILVMMIFLTSFLLIAWSLFALALGCSSIFFDMLIRLLLWSDTSAVGMGLVLVLVAINNSIDGARFISAIIMETKKHKGMRKQ